MGRFTDDERFKHVSYHETDVAKTFRRIRAEMKKDEEKKKTGNTLETKRIHAINPIRKKP